MLSKQKRFESSRYAFFEAGMRMYTSLLNEGPVKDMDPAVWSEVQSSYQVSFEALLRRFDRGTQESRTLFHKEHIDMLVNPTKLFRSIYPEDNGANAVLHRPDERVGAETTSCLYLPDDFLLSLLPVILIRHPALSIPSFFRAQRDTGLIKLTSPAMRAMGNLAWTHKLYD